MCYLRILFIQHVLFFCFHQLKIKGIKSNKFQVDELHQFKRENKAIKSNVGESIGKNKRTLKMKKLDLQKEDLTSNKSQLLIKHLSKIQLSHYNATANENLKSKVCLLQLIFYTVITNSFFIIHYLEFIHKYVT